MSFARNRDSRILWLKQSVVFSMLAALLIASKIAFEPLPNIHPVAALIVVYTLVYRVRALIPIYLFAFMIGLYMGFGVWWVPYLYVWTVLWGMAMLLPKSFSKPWYAVIYMLVCGFHGLIFGILYAPFQALAFGLDLKATVAWVVAGFPFDITHAIGNFAMGIIVFPLGRILKTLNERFVLN